MKIPNTGLYSIFPYISSTFPYISTIQVRRFTKPITTIATSTPTTTNNKNNKRNWRANLVCCYMTASSRCRWCDRGGGSGTGSLTADSSGKVGGAGRSPEGQPPDPRSGYPERADEICTPVSVLACLGCGVDDFWDFLFLSMKVKFLF